jgi:hypothetical protein
VYLITIIIITKVIPKFKLVYFHRLLLQLQPSTEQEFQDCKPAHDFRAMACKLGGACTSPDLQNPC